MMKIDIMTSVGKDVQQLKLQNGNIAGECVKWDGNLEKFDSFL